MPDLLTGTLGIRALVAACLAFMLLWWTVERLLGDNDDPSVSVGGDWILMRASGLPLIALTAVAVGLLLAPELLESETGVLGIVPLAAVIMLWWGYESEERE